jgi:hypothetical protein
MNLVQRVQDILLRPVTTWPEIDAESADVPSLYTQYICILAAIPAIASFIGLSLVGVGAFGANVRIPILSGLTRLVIGYVWSLVLVYVVSLIVDALAPSFGGRKNPISALKLVAYGGTAGFVGGVFSLLPGLSILGLLAAAYSIYLIYVGLPVVMKCPTDKAAVYTAAVVACACLVGLLAGALSAADMPSTMRNGIAGAQGSDPATVPGIRAARLEAATP